MNPTHQGSSTTSPGPSGPGNQNMAWLPWMTASIACLGTTLSLAGWWHWKKGNGAAPEHDHASEWLSNGMLLGGLIITGLLIALVRSLARSRQKAEQLAAEITRELQQSNSLFEGLLASVPDIVARFNSQLQYVYINPALTRALDLHPSHCLNKSNADLALPLHVREKIDIPLRETFQKPARKNIEFALSTPNGQCWFEAELVPEFTTEGAVESVLLVGRNVTERRSTAAALLESESRHRSLAECFPDPILVVAQGQVVYFNSAAVRFFQPAAAQDLIGKSLSHFLESRSHTACQHLLHQTVERGIPGDYNELQALCCNGSGVDVEMAMVPISWQGCRAALTVWRDITSRKQSDLQKRQALSRLETIVQSEPECVKVCALDGELLEMNPAGISILEAPGFESIKGRSVFELVHPGDREAYKAFHNQVASGRTLKHEFRIVSKKGNLRWMYSHGAPIPDPSGKTSQLLFVSSDITERIQAETNRQTIAEQLKACIEQTPYVAVQWYDANGRVVYWNSASESIFGFSASEAIGHTLDRLIHTPQEAALFQSLIEELIRTPRTVGPVEFSFKGKDGRMGTCLSTVFPIPSASGEKLVVCMDVDITEFKANSRKLEESNALLESRVQERTRELTQANQDLEAFSYSVSHDLRSPLRNASAFASLLADSLKLNPAENSESSNYMARLKSELLRMGSLIEDLLEFARLGRAELNRIPTPLNALVENVIRDLEIQCAGREVDWQVSPLPTVHVDPMLFRHVFVNLLENALKYSRNNPSSRIEIGPASSEEADGSSVFFVRDNGVGFDMRYASRLFGVFQRLHSVTQFEGTGIGLANVHRIITRHGGRIWARSAPGEGATFYIALPLPVKTGLTTQ